MQGVAACRVERGASSSICQRYSAAASGPAVAVVMAPRNQRMHSLRRKCEHAESYVMPRLAQAIDALVSPMRQPGTWPQGESSTSWGAW